MFSEESLYLRIAFCLGSFHARNDCCVEGDMSVVSGKGLFEDAISVLYDVLRVIGCVTAGLQLLANCAG